MLITNEHDRITYLPQSRLFSFLESAYSDAIEWAANGNPHELTAADLAAELEADQVDPLEVDHNGLEDSDLSSLWADLAYPLPHNADELAHSCYGVSPSDIARAALREYAAMYDVETLAAAVLQRLRTEYDNDNSSGNSRSSSN